MKLKQKNVFEITPEVHKALANTGYTGKSMKNVDDFIMINTNKFAKIYTAEGYKKSKQRTFLTYHFPLKLAETQKGEKFDSLGGNCSDKKFHTIKHNRKIRKT